MSRFQGMDRDERALLDGCKRGDEKAWLALYRAYSGDVGTYLKGMLRHSSEIDDLTQKVFLEFLASIERFRGESSLRTWLLRIGRNLALRDLRTKKRRNHYVRAYAETVGESGASPEGQIYARERLDQINSLLGTLETSFREVWVLRELSGCSVAEVANILELPEATVRTRHYRARRTLFALLKELDAHPSSSPKPAPLKLVSSKGGS